MAKILLPGSKSDEVYYCNGQISTFKKTGWGRWWETINQQNSGLMSYVCAVDAVCIEFGSLWLGLLISPLVHSQVAWLSCDLMAIMWPHDGGMYLLVCAVKSSLPWRCSIIAGIAPIWALIHFFQNWCWVSGWRFAWTLAGFSSVAVETNSDVCQNGPGLSCGVSRATFTLFLHHSLIRGETPAILLSLLSLRMFCSVL